MEITYPKEKGVIASYGADTGYVSPFDVKHLKKSAAAVKKANKAIKKRKAERFVMKEK